MIRKMFCGAAVLCFVMAMPLRARAEIVVAADGSGQFKTVQEAIDSIPAGKDLVTIHIKPGTYTQQVTISEAKPPIRMYGDDAPSTILVFNLEGKLKGPDGKAIGTFKTPSTIAASNDFEADDLTFANSTPASVSQALAISALGDRQIYRRCRFLGWQDTLYTSGKVVDNSPAATATSPSDAASKPTATTWPSDPSTIAAATPPTNRLYFEDSYIEGGVDFIFGDSTAVFRNCEIHSKRKGYLTAARTPAGVAYGYVFMNCKLTATTEVADGSVFLGRPWREYANVVYLNCDMGSQISPEGWSTWKSSPERIKTALFGEYHSTGPGGTPDGRMQYGHQLSDDEARAITIESVLGGADHWDPKPSAEATSQPTTNK